jgi:hypothetical protein
MSRMLTKRLVVAAQPPKIAFSPSNVPLARYEQFATERVILRKPGNQA